MKQISTSIIAIALLAGFSLSARTGEPFVRPYGFNLNSEVTGTGFGIACIPQLSIGLGERMRIASGPRFCALTWSFTGFETDFKYALMTEDESYCEHIRLSAYFSASYLQNNSLSLKLISQEKQMNAGGENHRIPDYGDLRFRGYECLTGINIDYYFDFGLEVQSRIGFGFYDTRQSAGPAILLCRESRSFSLGLGIGLGWRFKNNRH